MRRKALAGGHDRPSFVDVGTVGAAWVKQERRMGKLLKLLRCEEGTNAIEYALVASLIAIAAVGAFNYLGNKIDTMYNNVSNHL